MAHLAGLITDPIAVALVYPAASGYAAIAEEGPIAQQLFLKYPSHVAEKIKLVLDNRFLS